MSDCYIIHDIWHFYNDFAIVYSEIANTVFTHLCDHSLLWKKCDHAIKVSDRYRPHKEGHYCNAMVHDPDIWLSEVHKCIKLMFHLIIIQHLSQKFKKV